MDAQYWIKTLGLEAHPEEGGYFKEIYRSDESTSGLPARYRNESRSFGTQIYFLQQPHDPVYFRMMQSDECWNFYAGDPFIIYVLDGETGDLQKVGLGPQEDHHFYFTIPLGRYFAVKLKDPKPGSYYLAGTSLSPGFDRSDFSFANHEELAKKFPQHKELLESMKKMQKD